MSRHGVWNRCFIREEIQTNKKDLVTKFYYYFLIYKHPLEKRVMSSTLQ